MRRLFSFFSSAKLTQKLATFIVAMVLLVAAVVGTVAVHQGMESNLKAADDKLSAIVAARRAGLKTYLESIEQDLRSLAASPLIRKAIMEFRAAWFQLDVNQTEQLQRLYIHDNPHPTGKKEELDAASDGSDYSRAHARFHPYLRKFLRERGYYDIFLFDTEGNLIYTVFKELDYATNLTYGKWMDTGLGKVFRAAAEAGKADSISFFDFEPYAPSHGAPASFISTPVVGANGNFIGVLVFQMPIGRINEVMSVAAGLGDTGENIIVGRDKLMRNDSRFSKTSTILKQEVSTPAVGAAAAGKTGVTHGQGYRGQEMFSAFAPLDFHGVRWAVMSEQTSDEIHAPLAGMRNVVISLSALAALIGAVIGVFFARRVARPIVAMTGAMRELADGDNDVDVPGTGRGDEIGQMAKTVLVFKENAVERARLRSESEKEQEARAKRSAKMDELITNFDSAVRAVMGAVTSATDTVNMTAQEMSATAEETNAQAAAVAAAAEEASSSSATVAGSTEELTSTIDEISQKVMKSSEIAESATVQADGTNAQVAELAEAANKIGSVVELISAIAEQTNLLALNATIEAARAGEAGKGFAVVASEVKELAGQTAKATTEIGNHIEAVQTITGQSVTAIKGISETIEEINSMSASVASAITQQQAATQEIARAVQQAASGTNEVSTNITGVSEASGTTSAAASKLTAAASELSSQSGSLRHEVETFLAEVRAA